MKKLLLFAFSLLLISVAVMAQDADTFKDQLVAFGLNPTLVSMVLGLVGLILGHVAVPQKWISILALIEAGLHWVNERTNKLSKKQKEVKAVFDKEVSFMKSRGIVIPLTLLIMLLSTGVKAQSSWNGFLGPLDKAVKEKQVSLKTDGEDVNKPVFMFRPAASLTAVLVEFNSDTPLSSSLSAIGFGVSYGKYTPKLDGEAYCNFAINGSLWTSMLIGDDADTKMGLSVTGEVLNRLIGLGPVLYLDSGKPKVGLAVNLSYRF